jgi:cobalt/nickel transport system permease protein
MAATRLGNVPANFVERTLTSLVGAMEQALYAETLARTDGLLQELDPRIKVLGILALIIATALARNVWVILGLFSLGVLAAALSRVPLAFLWKRVWVAVFLLTATISLPALFLTPGKIVFQIPLLHGSITSQGLMTATYLVARVETTATFSILLILCTRWTHVLKALRVLGMPAVGVTILGMTYRYIFLLLQTAREMFEAHRARTVGALEGSDLRRMAAASAGVLMTKSFHFSSDVLMAMQSRGFQGEAHVLDDFQVRPADWLALLAIALITTAACWFGR